MTIGSGPVMFIAALLIAALFARSSIGVIREARHTLLAAEPQTLIHPRSNA